MSKLAAHIGSWGRWLLVVVLLVVKCYVFDALVAQTFTLKWELTDYLSGLAAAMLLALPVGLTKRRWPVFVILGLTDIYLLVNIIYYRAYQLFITWHLLSLAKNMAGFESSILPYCSLAMLWIPALSIPALACLLWKSKRMHIIEILSIIVLSIASGIGGCYAYWRNVRVYIPEDRFSWEWLNPCSMPRALSADISEQERQAARYIRYRSIYAYPIYMISDAVRAAVNHRAPQALTEEEKQELQRLLRPSTPPAEPRGNLLIILLESFESWPMTVTDAHGAPICPSLTHYIDTHEVLYVKNVESEIHYGMSADGQLIVNTGLYPLLEGVTCIRYADNTYPNLAHFFPQSAIVNPCRNVWNQRAITPAYGYKQLIEPNSEYRFAWNDSVAIDKMIETLTALPSPACVMGITVSGHIPFDSSPDSIALSDTIPPLIRRYLQTAHFTDRQVGRLLAWADTAQVMQGSTIVITGDHRIFHAGLNEEVREYGLRARLPFGTGQSYCPLLMIGPKVPGKRIEYASQMDIYPSILEAIGQNTYYWTGFGASMLGDYTADNNKYHLHRQISDKIIRMNYFKDLWQK